MKRKYTLLTNLAYLLALLLLAYTFGIKHGILAFIALMMFGWGMNLENTRKDA